MEDKDALVHLIKLLENPSLTEEQKEAVKMAVGVLSWTKLRKGALERMREKRKAI